jgi:imidazolonepropionase-like amidohydrolase
LVREYKQAGYDLLKVHEGLTPESYDAIVKTADSVGMRFGGHIPDSVGLDGALAARQSSIDHIDGYLEALEADDSPLKNADAQTRGAKLHLYLDEKKIPTLVNRTKQAGAWVVPTHALWQTFMGTESLESLQKRPELRYVPAGLVNNWSQQRSQQLAGVGPDDRAALDRMLSLRDKILKALADGKAGVLLGSDAPQLFSVPGFSLQREMEAMSSAGLTPYQILESGTRAPAIYMNLASDFGTVEVGKRADLILLDKNPLLDIRNMSARAGVMVAGRWLPAAELQRMLETTAVEMAPIK